MRWVGGVGTTSAAFLVRSDAFPLVQDLKHRCGDAHRYRFPHELVRHGVKMPLDRDVVVDVDLGLTPLTVLVTCCR
jgi:hypothetical protein